MNRFAKFDSFLNQFFLLCTYFNIEHNKVMRSTAFSTIFLVYLNFKELSLAVICLFSLSVVGNSGVAAFEGSKSIKIHQCNENLAVVDEWPLFRGAVIQGFHCMHRPWAQTHVGKLGRKIETMDDTST